MSGLLTWAQGQYSTHTGTAGGIRLFSINWKTRREDPNWLMRCDLPGYAGQEWKDDDMDALQASAEEVAAEWIAAVTGLAREDEPSALAADYASWYRADRAHECAGEAASFEAGWLARAARLKGAPGAR
jgi:hypothetical protein